ncbi:MAG: group III truncated hemoglobin [Pseudomonadota bacterium]
MQHKGLIDAADHNTATGVGGVPVLCATPMVHPGKSEITREDIAVLVAGFYTRVRADARLGPIFERKIGKTDAEWQPHLRKIEAFWANVMLHERAYRGNPMQAHLAVAAIETGHFAIWLDLFEATARDLLPESKAAAFNTLARRIGSSLSMGIEQARGGAVPRLSRP